MNASFFGAFVELEQRSHIPVLFHYIFRSFRLIVALYFFYLELSLSVHAYDLWFTLAVVSMIVDQSKTHSLRYVLHI